MDPSFSFFAGVDWASQEHSISILGCDRTELEHKVYPHSGAGLNQLVDRLLALSENRPAVVAIGIETPHGAVVETLARFSHQPFLTSSKSEKAKVWRNCREFEKRKK